MLLSCILMKDYLWGTSPHADGKTLSNQTNSMRLTTSHYTDNNPVKDQNKISSHLPHRYKMFLISTNMSIQSPFPLWNNKVLIFIH